ncbi:hypothetical protein Scep_023696 [Stephania cephalantha]|uniref:Exportin-1/Importin-beta-like domain-containing protein n=1 Tax=Stephania cephalantha TaxID=152367 RepID=A0AAP0EV54_9MAGN
MTDQELELELNEAGTRLGDPPSSVDDLLGILDETCVSKGKNDKEQSGGQSSGATRGSTPQPPDFEAKVAKLTELGFGRDAVIQRFSFSTEMRSRLLVISLGILKHEWSARWQSFVPDLVSAAKTSETICENCMAILKVTSISISLSRLLI